MCSGCVSLERGYPDKRYFVLETTAKPSPANPSANETLQVSDMRVSQRYAGRGFVYRTSETAYESDFYNQFLVSPASLITEEVRKVLIDSQLFKYVISSSHSLQPSYVLEGSVNALYGDFRNANSPRAVLEMEFFLTSEIPAKAGILMQKRYARECLPSRVFHWSRKIPSLKQLWVSWHCENRHREHSPSLPVRSSAAASSTS